MKTSIVVLSDPRSGGEEVEILFQGAGTPGLPSLARYLGEGYAVPTF